MILYLGNNLKSKSVTQTTMLTLSEFLILEGYDVKLVSSHNIQLFRLLSMIWAVIKYSSKIDTVLIDTYSTRNFYYAVITGRLCKILRLKYIPILHGGNLPNRLERSPKLSEALFENSFKNVAPSNYLKNEFEKRGYTVEYIPNVLELKNYNYLQRGISTPKLLYVRAFAKIYNPEMAIKVLNEVKKEYPGANLCMIGPTKDESFASCKDLVKSLKLEDSVEFAGKLSKEKWIEKSEAFNIFINTANVDNTPISVMEAMALGLPVVSTNVGGIPYLVDNKVDGLLVERNNVTEMVNAIILLCQEKELSKSFVINARKKSEQFDWEIVKHHWINILE